MRPGPDPGRHGASVPAAARRARSRSTYPSEAVKSVLERTLGVPIFQEQVMQLAMVAAGFTPGEADQLRRAMAAWKRSGGLEQFEQRLIDGMRAQRLRARVRRADLPADPGLRRVRLSRNRTRRASRCWSTSRAWLKRHHPAAFCARAAQQPADGLLRAGAARAGRAPPRRRGAAGGRERERLGLHARGRRAAPRAAHGERTCPRPRDGASPQGKPYRSMSPR